MPLFALRFFGRCPFAEPVLSGEILPLHFVQGQNDKGSEGLRASAYPSEWQPSFAALNEVKGLWIPRFAQDDKLNYHVAHNLALVF